MRLFLFRFVSFRFIRLICPGRLQRIWEERHLRGKESQCLRSVQKRAYMNKPIDNREKIASFHMHSHIFSSTMIMINDCTRKQNEESSLRTRTPVYRQHMYAMVLACRHLIDTDQCSMWLYFLCCWLWWLFNRLRICIRWCKRKKNNNAFSFESIEPHYDTYRRMCVTQASRQDQIAFFIPFLGQFDAENLFFRCPSRIQFHRLILTRQKKKETTRTETKRKTRLRSTTMNREYNNCRQ
jgi:hypothetical protein